MKYMKRFSILLLGLFHLHVFAQSVVVSENPNPIPESSAILEVQSTTMGFLPPRLTFSQRTSIVNPATGLVVYGYASAATGSTYGVYGRSDSPDGIAV